RFYKEQRSIFIAAAFAGSTAKPKEFDHIAAIGWTNQDRTGIRWLCGGSLIWENFILTAAHCTVDDNNKPPDVARMLDLNIAKDDQNAVELKIIDIIRHPNYLHTSTYYDIALLKLEKNTDTTEILIPTCLWLEDEIRFPKLEAAGWGATGLGENVSEILLKVEFAPVDKEECSRYYPKGDRKHRNGLMDHQLCAGDKTMDTCPGDSGGPLQVKLVKAFRLIPFLVGVTSFGKACGLYLPGVYTKVSKFGAWIIETLQRYGESVTLFDFHPMVCAARYEDTRELGYPYGTAPLKRNCAGTLIEPNVVLTTAECVLHKEATPTQVLLVTSNVIDIAEIIVHPLYNPSNSLYYNNIAVVKLKSFAPIEPFCAWYGHSNPDQKLLLTAQDSTVSMTTVFERSSKQCPLAQQYIDLLPQGLQDEHLCYGNQTFIVPGLCNALQGSPIERNDGTYVYIEGISLFGRDCGYGELAVGVRLSAHKAWLESVLLPRPEEQPLVYIDPDRKLLDDCMYTDRTKGTCVAEQDCPAIHARLQKKQQISFCSNGTVVCCPNKASDPRMMAIENEFNECEERYRRLRTDRQNGSSHAVEIGWQNHHNTTYGCYGYLISTRGVVSSASCLLEKGELPNIARIGGIDSLDNASIIRIEKVAIHPHYNPTTAHNIAILKLKSVVEPTESVFPACLWQSLTHSPVEQKVLDFASALRASIHPMYKSDCEALLNRSFDQFEHICMNPGYRPYSFTTDFQIRYKNKINVPDHCYSAGSPIVWRKPIDNGLHVEYLVHIYSHGECGPETPRVVNRVAAYIEWFKEVLQ
uniref:Peptidase S1 domain-containing protein n=1 Tax=Anopheles coluzzii TaxID=1518534 RepID=A0A6E8W5E3_ANOCL